MKLLYLKQKIAKRRKLSLGSPSHCPYRSTNHSPLFLSTHLLFFLVVGRPVPDRRVALVLIPHSPLITNHASSPRPARKGLRPLPQSAIRRIRGRAVRPGPPRHVRSHPPITNHASFTPPARKGLRALPQSAIRRIHGRAVCPDRRVTFVLIPQSPITPPPPARRARDCAPYHNPRRPPNHSRSVHSRFADVAERLPPLPRYA
jgi:hypothetical protein